MIYFWVLAALVIVGLLYWGLGTKGPGLRAEMEAKLKERDDTVAALAERVATLEKIVTRPSLDEQIKNL